MTNQRRRKILDFVFYASLAGFLVLLVCMILGWVIVSTTSTTEIELPVSLKTIGNTGGTIFLLGSLLLWVHSVWVTFELSRTNEADGIRVFFVIVGTFFAAYILYFLDRTKLR